MKINLGCGWECRDGWINADNTKKPQKENYPITYMDVTAPWEYDDNTFDYVLSEHMIEHIPDQKNLFMLKEAFRCLKPDGVIRITCPSRTFYENLPGRDDHVFVHNYVRKIFKREPRQGDAALISRRTLREQGHVWVPTASQLMLRLKEAGFDKVYGCIYGISDYPELNGIELDDGVRRYESLCVEGIKK